MSNSTVTESVTDEDASAAASASKRKRRPLRLMLIPVSIVAIVVIVAAILVGSWFTAAADATHNVHITATDTALRCAGGQTRNASDENDLGTQLQVALVTPSINCTLRVEIHNGSTVPITINRITYGGLGKQSEYAYVDTIDGQPSKSNPSGPDAYGVPTTTVLAPGATVSVTAHITKSPLTCIGNGTSYFWDNEFPELNLTALGIGGERKPTNVHFGFLGTKSSTDASCRK